MRRQRFLIFLLIFLVGLVFSGITIHASDDNIVTSHNGSGKYQYLETVESLQLHEYVYYQKDLGQTSTSLDKTPDGEDKNAAGKGGGGLLIKDKFYGQQINVLMGKATSNMKVVSWGYTTSSRYELRDVINLAKDYERNHPGWKVIGGINADFFDMQGTGKLPYQPLGPMISDGEVTRAGGSNNYSLMVGFKNKGQPDDLVVKKYIHTNGTLDEYVGGFILTIYDENGNEIKTFTVDNYNKAAGENQISIYYANWSSEQKIVPQAINSSGNVFVVENAEKALANSSNDFYGRGVITSTEPKELGEKEFAIVSRNPEATELLKVGTKVRVMRTFTGPYSEVEELAVGHGYLIHDGEESQLLNESYYYTRAPRSIVGIKADGTIVMLTIDGRQPDKNMFGATQEEMVAIMKYYGCVGAYNLDGGGSTTMIIRRGNSFEVVNSPSDNSVRRVANAIFFVVYEPEFTSNPIEINRNSVSIKVDILDAKGVDVKNLYVELNGEINKVENGIVSFDNLMPNTQYLYTFYYDTGDGNLIKTISGGSVKTAKRTGQVKNISYEEKGSELIVTVEFDDPDNSITRARVFVGDNAAYVNSNIAIIRNAQKQTDGSYHFTIVYRVDLQNLKGYFEITLKNPPLKLHNYVDFAKSKQTIIINEILK